MSEIWTPEILERFRKIYNEEDSPAIRNFIKRLAPEAFEEKWTKEAKVFIGKRTGDPYFKIDDNVLLNIPGFVKVPFDGRVKDIPMKDGTITLTVRNGKIAGAEVKET